MTTQLTPESEALLAELQENPLPGARYAYTVVKRDLAAIEAAAIARYAEGLTVERLAWAIEVARTGDAEDANTTPRYGSDLDWARDILAALAIPEAQEAVIWCDHEDGAHDDVCRPREAQTDAPE